MKRYNYFDDEPEEAEKPKINKKLTIGIKKAAGTVKQTAVDIVHGDAFTELKELPLLRRRLMKICAVCLFILVLLIFIIAFSHTITQQNKKNDTFCSDAGKVCTEYIKEYGSIKWDILDETVYGENQVRLTGLCYARQMDFDNDGSDELMLCYNNKNVYYLEVWGYSGRDFVQFYSREANSTEKDTDGVWVSFYHKNKKYYICKSEKSSPDSVTLYGLHGDKFKAESKQWDYDYENDIYSYNGKINARDFETIKLSVFRKSRADIIADTVTGNLDSFGNISSQAIINSKSKIELQADAYYEAVKKRIDRYGAPKIEDGDGYSYIDGVAMVRLIDFDGDSSEELLVIYRKYKSKSKYDNYSGEYINYEVPMYGMDIYDFNGTTARRIFSKESISNCLNDENENIFYLMLQTGKKTTNICSNTYTFENSYSYTGVSKVYKLTDGRFETTYSAKLVNEYGYRQYYIDNQRVYNSQFEEQGHKVPLFLNDDGTVDVSKYSVTYLSGRNEAEFQKIIDETNKTILELNPDYLPQEITDDD